MKTVNIYPTIVALKAGEEIHFTLLTTPDIASMREVLLTFYNEEDLLEDFLAVVSLATCLRVPTDFEDAIATEVKVAGIHVGTITIGQQWAYSGAKCGRRSK